MLDDLSQSELIRMNPCQINFSNENSANEKEVQMIYIHTSFSTRFGRYLSLQFINGLLGY
jgi:hypothetical protein